MALGNRAPPVVASSKACLLGVTSSEMTTNSTCSCRPLPWRRSSPASIGSTRPEERAISCGPFRRLPGVRHNGLPLVLKNYGFETGGSDFPCHDLDWNQTCRYSEPCLTPHGALQPTLSWAGTNVLPTANTFDMRPGCSKLSTTSGAVPKNGHQPCLGVPHHHPIGCSGHDNPDPGQ
ncbi:hypothetical protein EDB80DRAFT_71154 [Ilyonectria destructans]|nr:hypothetical protein EDB80DRAFT_71154 [Ilyonectria destructans]